MNCENCDLEIGDTDAASGQSAKWNWNFCPECGVNLAPLKKLVKPKPGQSEESKAKASELIDAAKASANDEAKNTVFDAEDKAKKEAQQGNRCAVK